MQLAFILGRTPALSRLEIESVATILPFPWSLASVQPRILRLKPETEDLQVSLLKDGVQSEQLLKVLDKAHHLQQWLGGTMKIVFLEELVERRDVLPVAQKIIAALQGGVEGKRTVGLSAYGRGIGPFRIGMALKKALRSDGGSGVRIVLPTEGEELSSAQILKNALPLRYGVNPANLELNIIEEGGKHWIGVTLQSQDIDAYTKRDFGVPKPDPVSGMLPPKLAQSMINLAAQAENVAVYDPFCGNGRIVMEAQLMEVLEPYGSDIVPTKVESAIENLNWLDEHNHLDNNLWVADATDTKTPVEFRERCPYPKEFVIAGEPYLGRPLRANLKPEEKAAWLAELLPLYEKFLVTWSAGKIGPELRPKRMVLVFPRAKVEGGGEASVYDALVDTANRLGYDSDIRFTYDRPDSYVRRDLVSLEYSK